jgi:hypothetical protein
VSGFADSAKPAPVPLDWLRIAWGTVCLLAPAQLAAALGGPTDRRTTAVTRVLGTRHVLQGVVSVAAPTGAVLVAGGLIDVLHSTSMAVLGGFAERYRRLAWTDGVIAASWGAASLLTGRRVDRTASQDCGGGRRW